MNVIRHFTVATFVVHQAYVLLHRHARLELWLPPGGHIEPNELPDEAAVREVLEETGVRARLVGERALPISYPEQLVVPAGVQVEDIEPGHQHIDLVYFAVPEAGGEDVDPRCAGECLAGWYRLEELAGMDVNDEIRSWCVKAVAAVDGAPASQRGET